VAVSNEILDLRTEEDVKIKFLLPLLERLGYKAAHCEFEKTIEIQEGRKQKSIFADVVVYTSGRKTAPLIVCDTKAPTEILDRFAKEQVISYARLLPQIAPLALITNGSHVQVFQTLNKNRIPELPPRKSLNRDLADFFVSAELQKALRQEAKHDLFIIDDVQTFKSVLASCHNQIRNNEGYDPTVAFDEMSKVLFCKMYEEKHQAHSNRFRLAVYDDSLQRLGVNVVKQILAETKADTRYAGLFTPDTQISLHDRTIRSIVCLFENYDLSLTAFDVKGEAFEYFLGDTFTGGLGEYFTPRNIVEFIVDAINPKIGETIVDPFCGTGGFLIYAFEVVSEKIRLQDFSEAEKERWRIELSNRSLFGTDWKERTSQACKMNMMVHGDGSAGIFMHHGLTDVPGHISEATFDICLTNPPFGSVETDSAILGQYELGAGRKSQDRVPLALERAIRLVKPGGRIGIVVIDGILNNSSMRYVRDYLKRNAIVRGVVSLTSETFQGYGARAKTSVLFLEKKPQPDDGAQPPTFFAIASNTGYAANGAQIAGNQLPDILMQYRRVLDGEPLADHRLTWIAQIDDRLDAEFYQRTDPTIGGNLKELHAEIEETLSLMIAEQHGIATELASLNKKAQVERVPLSELIEQVRERESVHNDKLYRLIGVRWWGGGAFIREEKFGRDIAARILFRVSPGRVIYNRLFAFRGSFAVLDDDHNGCYVSGEFPTFNLIGQRPHLLIAKFIVYCLNSPQYLRLIDRLSTGSTKTSRNRFNQAELLKLSLDLPAKDSDVEHLVRLMDRAASLKLRYSRLEARLKQFQDGLGTFLPQPPA
jgi:type I restriction enzyme M protein